MGYTIHRSGFTSSKDSHLMTYKSTNKDFTDFLFFFLKAVNVFCGIRLTKKGLVKGFPFYSCLKVTIHDLAGNS